MHSLPSTQKSRNPKNVQGWRSGRVETAEDAVVATSAPADVRGGGVELLLLLGIAVGILRADGLRVRAAPLHDAWRQLDDTLRPGSCSPPGASTRRFYALWPTVPRGRRAGPGRA
jgi:hypothetical protein